MGLSLAPATTNSGSWYSGIQTTASVHLLLDGGLGRGTHRAVGAVEPLSSSSSVSLSFQFMRFGVGVLAERK